MRKNLRKRKTCTVSEELLLHSKTYFKYHLYKENTDTYGDESYCGKTVRLQSTDDITLEILKTNCYECLDIVVHLGKECADRLAELPPRVS